MNGVERLSAATWFPPQEPADCALCRQLLERAGARALEVAGRLALDFVGRTRVSGLAGALMTRWLEMDKGGRISLLVPEPGGRWRVFASSDGAGTHDVMLESARYPELGEVRRTGSPIVVRSITDTPEFADALPALLAAGVKAVAALPVFVGATGADPVVLKFSLPRELDPATEALVLLFAHLLVHRLSRVATGEVARELGLSPVPEGVWNPATLLRLLPVPALLVDGADRVSHANGKARWLLREPGKNPQSPVELRFEPERPWLGHDGRWEAELVIGQRRTAVLGWSGPAGPDHHLVLLEPHPLARRQVSEGRLRSTLAEKLRELEEANAQLEEHARRRARFVSDAAHELKTPIAIIRSYLDTLGEDLAGTLDAEQREFLNGAAQGALRLQRLVEGLLDLAALEAGHLSIELGPVSAAEVVEAVVAELRPLAQQGGVELSARGGPDAGVRADRQRLEQVLRNVIENGVKYTPRGGAVEVGFERRSDWVVFTVADTGIGIAAEALPGIFDEFVRAPGSAAAGGVGIGLSIVRRLVLAMAGRVWAESAPGRGSRFSVELPAWLGKV